MLSDSPVGCVYLTDAPGTGQPQQVDLMMTLLVHGRYAAALNGLAPGEIARRVLAGIDRMRVRVRPTGSPVRFLSGVSRFVTDVRVFDYPRAVAHWPIAQQRSRFGAVAAALRMSAVLAQRLGAGELVHP